ncbi:MAG: B12-binding domain-containing radical SAM protein [Candidatus Helarchaeota archaeon]
MTSKTRICLVQCDYPKNHSFIIKDIIFPPLGLEYLAANIKDIAEIRIFDNRFPEYSLKNLKKEFEKFRPNFVGIGVNFSNQIYHANAIAKIAKDIGAKVIMGGWHATAVPEDTLSFPWTDIVIRGEGELALRELIQKGNPSNIKGISYKKNGKIIHNPDQELLNLDLFSPPARNFRPKFADKYYNFFGVAVDSMETSRGCPFRCKFCNIHNFYRHKYRTRPIHQIIQDLNQIENSTKLIYIIDDNFTAYRSHVIKVCNAIIKRKIKKAFMSTSRLDQVVKHPEIYELMAKAGFIFAFVGIESFSNKTLKNLNKQLELKQIQKGIKILHDLGFIIQGNIILGANFNDTKKDLELTLQIAKSLDIDIPTFSLLTPYPMTALWDEVNEKGLLLDNINWHSFNWNNPIIKYLHLSPEDLKYYLNKAYFEVKRFKNPINKLINIIKARGLSFFISTFITQGGIKSLTRFIKRIYPGFFK